MAEWSPRRLRRGCGRGVHGRRQGSRGHWLSERYCQVQQTPHYRQVWRAVNYDISLALAFFFWDRERILDTSIAAV